MPKNMMKVEKNKRISGLVTKKASDILKKGAFISPSKRTVEVVSVSFEPTAKSQSGNFSRSTVTIPPPRFNVVYLNTAGYGNTRFSHSQMTPLGVRNPYAVINNDIRRQNAINKKFNTELIPLYEWKPMPPPHYRSLLSGKLKLTVKNKLTGKPEIKNFPYEHLFDPAYGGPLFSSSFSGVHAPSTNTNVATGATDRSTTCTNVGIDWVVYSSLEWVSAESGYVPRFDAPCQGPADDCWLIAALSSIAWTQPDALMADNNTGIFILDPNASYTDQIDNDGGYITADDKLPIPSIGASATESRFWYSYSKYPEKWVAMMERAFGKRKLGQEYPDMCTIGKGDPQYALYILRGDYNWTRFFNVTLGTNAISWEKEVNNPATYNPDSLWNELYNNCYPPNISGSYFYKTQCATVAFTYDTGDPAKTNGVMNGAAAAPQGSGVEYNSDLLVGSHSYSVLGLYEENNQKYIVLRNPWGYIKNVKKCENPNLAIGRINGFEDGIDRELWDDNDFLMDGVFALKWTEFCKYFRGLSWV
jgi:hypothetical protein